VAAVEVEDAEMAVVVDAEMAKDAEMARNQEVVEIRTRITTTNLQFTDVNMTRSLPPRPLKTLLSRKEEVEAVVTMELRKTIWQDKPELIPTLMRQLMTPSRRPTKRRTPRRNFPKVATMRKNQRSSRELLLRSTYELQKLNKTLNC